MAAAEDSALLARIANDPALFDYFLWPCDVDVTRRDPVERLHLPSGAPLEPVAGDSSGGTYFLAGEPGKQRPVIFADSEGTCVLVADSLWEALEVMVGIPFWTECLFLSPADRDRGPEELLEELEEDFLDDRPDFDPERQRAAARALGMDLIERSVLLRRLADAGSRTAPDHVVHGPDGRPYRVRA